MEKPGCTVSSRSSSFLKRESCVIIKPRHTPAKLSVNRGFTVNRVVFHFKGRLPALQSDTAERPSKGRSVLVSGTLWTSWIWTVWECYLCKYTRIPWWYGDSWAGIRCASFMPHQVNCNCTLEYRKHWLYAQKCRQWQEKQTRTISTHPSMGLIREGKWGRGWIVKTTRNPDCFQELYPRGGFGDIEPQIERVHPLLTV